MQSDRRLRRFRWSFVPFLFIAICLSRPSTVDGQDARRGDETAASDLPVAPTVSELVRLLILDAAEDEYVDERHWGMTTDRFDGVKVQGLKVSKRKKEVNHGQWYRYKAALVRPEETLTVRIEPLDPPQPGTMSFAVTTRLRARCEATFANWTYGTKGLNGTVVSHATVALRLVFNVTPRMHVSWTQPVPRLDLQPQVADVRLRLVDLDVRRVGVFGGSIASLLGDGSRSTVERLIESQERNLKRRLQSKLDAELN